MTTSAHQPFKIGYARVSTNAQDEALQLDALQQAQVDRVFVDRASGSVQDRPGLTSALECARSGDSLVVWRLDRLGRSQPAAPHRRRTRPRAARRRPSQPHRADRHQHPRRPAGLPRVRQPGAVRARAHPRAHRGRAGRRPGPRAGRWTTDGVDPGQAQDGPRCGPAATTTSPPSPKSLE